ncbi:unnamed protein product [Cylicocyclus nassatus]|uniref:Uncharacterized protein n=1 Tax=Cylicocyclus nassatus TaxID=53992 RepID=A0AA36HDL7_CYLNA|nr:unnamed protein product [Cylicocyclus nassatus]
MSCSEAKELINNQGFLAAVSSQAVAGFLSIVVSVIVTKQSKTLYFHINCKAVHLIRYVVISDPCQVGLSSSLCIYLRAPTNICTMSFSLFQLMSSLERMLALWKHRSYGLYGPTFGYASAGFCIFVPIGVLFWQLENADFQGMQTYCSIATAQTRDRIEKVCFITCGINMATLLGLTAIFVFNKVARKR